MYKGIWTTVIGETLSSTREPDNANDRYAVAVLKGGMIIGHLPRKIGLK